MKKFRFSLQKVLEYKQQVLDSLQTEHGAILAEVRQQEEVVFSAEARYRFHSGEFTRRQEEGMSVRDARMMESSLRALEDEIRRETELLQDLYRRAEEKRLEVVEAKKENASIEKLREKKQKQYLKEEQKAEELFIEDIVTTMRLMNVQ